MLHLKLECGVHCQCHTIEFTFMCSVHTFDSQTTLHSTGIHYINLRLWYDRCKHQTLLLYTLHCIRFVLQSATGSFLHKHTHTLAYAHTRICMHRNTAYNLIYSKWFQQIPTEVRWPHKANVDTAHTHCTQMIPRSIEYNNNNNCYIMKIKRSKNTINNYEKTVIFCIRIVT